MPEDLRRKVRDAYSAVARNPRGPHPFPVGREFARSLGYPAELLDKTPAASVEAFTGVSDISLVAEIRPGMTVADVGCGAGLDTFVAARKAGRVIGIDFSYAMLGLAQAGAAAMKLNNALFCRAAAESLPIATASVNVALVNGIFNLNPARQTVISELARVLRPGGAVYAAELILTRPLPPEIRQSETDWFA